jgi:hypothetical protein
MSNPLRNYGDLRPHRTRNGRSYCNHQTLCHPKHTLTCQLIELVRKQKYAPLARTLNSDFCDLHHVAPVEDGPEARLMFTMIKCIIDKWFVQPKEADVDTWYPTAELLELAKSLNAKDADEAQINSEMSAMITKEVKQRVGATSRDGCGQVHGR